jgi:hypothetical protein
MAEKGYIICVDDDLALLETLWQQLMDLTSATHEVVMAKSAEEGLQALYELQHQCRACPETGCWRSFTPSSPRS